VWPRHDHGRDSPSDRCHQVDAAPQDGRRWEAALLQDGGRVYRRRRRGEPGQLNRQLERDDVVAVNVAYFAITDVAVVLALIRLHERNILVSLVRPSIDMLFPSGHRVYLGTDCCGGASPPPPI